MFLLPRKLVGLIPDEPSFEQASAILAMLTECPHCGSGSSLCDLCFGVQQFFWTDTPDIHRAIALYAPRITSYEH